MGNSHFNTSLEYTIKPKINPILNIDTTNKIYAIYVGTCQNNKIKPKDKEFIHIAYKKLLTNINKMHNRCIIQYPSKQTIEFETDFIHMDRRCIITIYDYLIIHFIIPELQQLFDSLDYKWYYPNESDKSMKRLVLRYHLKQ